MSKDKTDEVNVERWRRGGIPEHPWENINLDEVKLNAFWASSAPRHPLSAWIRQRNRNDIEVWEQILPDEDDDIDMHHLLQTLAAYGACGIGDIRLHLHAALLMRRMPDFKKLALNFGHINQAMLAHIFRELSDVPKDSWPLFEQALIELFSPFVQAQEVPSKRRVTTKLRQLKASQEEEEEEKEKAPARYLKTDDTARGGTVLKVGLEADEAREVLAAIENVAKREDVELPDAFLMLIRQQTKATTILNIYGPDADSPACLEGDIWLRKTRRQYWAQRVDKVRDLPELKDYVVEGHDPKEGQKAIVRGRDGHCRAPGCTVRARYCDIDHVVEYGLGGPTTVANLQALCREHHNEKTDGRVRVFMDQHGRCHWHYPGMEVITTVPEGPLAEVKNAHWGTSWKAWSAYRDKSGV